MAVVCCPGSGYGIYAMADNKTCRRYRTVKQSKKTKPEPILLQFYCTPSQNRMNVCSHWAADRRFNIQVMISAKCWCIQACESMCRFLNGILAVQLFRSHSVGSAYHESIHFYQRIIMRYRGEIPKESTKKKKQQLHEHPYRSDHPRRSAGLFVCLMHIVASTYHVMPEEEISSSLISFISRPSVGRSVSLSLPRHLPILSHICNCIFARTHTHSLK